MNNIKSILILVIVLFALNNGCRAPIEIQQTHEEPVPDEQIEVEQIFTTKTDWVEETLSRLSVEEKIGQMIMPRGYGYFTNTESNENQRMMRFVKEKKVGGVCFFQGDIYSTAVTINKLQEISNVPLLISADFERGGPMRIRRMTSFPEAMALGASRRKDLANKMGKIVASESRAIGVHQNFAPVADINNNAINPVINIRSFGESPELVAELASEYATGMQSGGLIATAKHFPGHGDTDVDSHYDLPVLNVKRERMDIVELFPFMELINKGVMSVMTAHIALPNLETQKRLPASLSKMITTDILEDELGFKGLIITDGLEMKGVSKFLSINEAAVMSVEAGADILLLPPDEDAAIEAILNAIRTKRISIERINKSVRKILALKEWLKLDENRFTDINSISDVVSTPENLSVAKEIAQSSITVVQNNNALPLQPGKNTLVVIVSDTDDYRTDINRTSNTHPNERVGDYLISQMRERSRKINSARISPRSNKIDFDDVLTKAKSSDILVIAIYVKFRSGNNPFGITEQMIDFLNLLTENISKNKKQKSIIVSFGNPYPIGNLKNADAVLFAFSDVEASIEAAVEVAYGEISARGRLPVTIPEFKENKAIGTMFSYGSGINVIKSTLSEEKISAKEKDRKFSKIEKIMQTAVNEKAFPGAQLLVAQNGEVVFQQNFGKLDYAKDATDVSDSTIFDLASLTKVFATTLAIMKLYDDGKVSLNDKVIQYIPEFGNKGKEIITIRNLLKHDSGLPAWQKFYLDHQSGNEILNTIYNSELLYRTGDSTLYSDFGFIVLGKIVEKVTGISLDAYMKKEFYEPLGMENTYFNPSKELSSRIAPTEFDSVWRQSLVHGSVHDEAASMLGGIAGHAGLFSNVSDLSILSQMILNGGSYGGVRYIEPETIKLFTERSDLKSKRGLGWDYKTLNGYSSAGKLFSPKSFGHTGFTGTSIWFDPEENLFVLLLTNRVYPSRVNTKIAKVRSELHDTIIESNIN